MMLSYLLFGFTVVVGLVIYLAALFLVRVGHYGFTFRCVLVEKLSSPPAIVVSGRVVQGASARRAPQGRTAEVRRGYPGGPASRAMTSES